MQNIDPLFIIYPLVVIGFSFGLVVYWHYRRKFTRWDLLFSFLAYAGAIALKYAVQIPTIHSFESATGGNPLAMGVYYGSQTVFFEVGGAYLVARYAIRRKKLGRSDAEGYGLGLALWENGVLIGLVTLLNFVTYYAILSSGAGTLSQTLYDALLKSEPGLFNPPGSALPSISLDILERISSLLAHFSWGYLVVLSVVFRRKLLLAAALPMGLIDFFVPFASSIGVLKFELLIFFLSVSFFVLAITLARKAQKGSSQSLEKTLPEGAKSKSLYSMIFRRSLSYGRVYLIMGLVISVLFIGETALTLNALKNLAQGSGSEIAGEIYPLLLPLTTIIGATGALMVFSSDKAKGVYEYLIAYGVNPSTIFWSVVVASIGLVSIILIVSVPVAAIVFALLGLALPSTFNELLILYSIPLSFTSTAFMTMAGMIWQSLSTRRAGLNSPVGAAPVLGIVPVMTVFLLSLLLHADLILLVGAVSLAVLVSLGVMTGVANKKMQRERFLSNV